MGKWNNWSTSDSTSPVIVLHISHPIFSLQKWTQPCSFHKNLSHNISQKFHKILFLFSSKYFQPHFLHHFFQTLPNLKKRIFKLCRTPNSSYSNLSKPQSSHIHIILNSITTPYSPKKWNHFPIIFQNSITMHFVLLIVSIHSPIAYQREAANSREIWTDHSILSTDRKG